MIVITLTSCPPALRGDLTAWLQEIDTCVFAGNVGARVRDELWDRIMKHIGSGRATMTFSARNEQGMDFRVHNASRELIDYDGLKLVLRPSAMRLQTVSTQPSLSKGFSNAARMHKARRFAGHKPASPRFPDQYLVMDLETTGLSPHQDRIIEIGALKVGKGEVQDSFHALITIDGTLPPHIIALTGITDRMLEEQGRDLAASVQDFFAFAGSLTIVSHQVSFDTGFLRAACSRLGLTMPDNPYVDTCALARRLVKDARDWKLSTLAEHLDIRTEASHRSLADCQTTKLLFDKLIELSNGAE